MSTPVLEEWFSIDIRRNRKSFMLSTIALYATFGVCYFIWISFAETTRGENLGLAVFGIPAEICSYLLVAQRLRDFSVSGWLALLWIPINLLDGQIRVAVTLAALIVLCAIPGTNGPNKFGDDPLI